MNKKTNNLRTVLIVYSNYKVTIKEAAGMKHYSFNTDAQLKIGDRIKSDDYDTPMQVVDVLPTSYKYVNLVTGEFSNKRTSTKQFELRHLVEAVKEHKNIVYFTKE